MPPFPFLCKGYLSNTHLLGFIRASNKVGQGKPLAQCLRLRWAHVTVNCEFSCETQHPHHLQGFVTYYSLAGGIIPIHPYNTDREPAECHAVVLLWETPRNSVLLTNTVKNYRSASLSACKQGLSGLAKVEVGR